MPTTWQDEIEIELQIARKAAQDQMGGRSRVAARRAAGIAVREYNRLKPFTQNSYNYYNLMVAFSTHPSIPDEIQQVARRLCQRVNEQYNLPEGYDLITDAEILVEFVNDHTYVSAKKGE
jgi:hypothetical protein